MNRDTMREAVLELPVWDTHTHLTGRTLAARDFWEIAHYFWFLLELQAAGYPSPREPLSDQARVDAFLRAFQATRNTSMNWVVRRIFERLYGVTLSDAASVRAADAAVRERAADEAWPGAVCRGLGIRRIVVNEPEDAEFRGLPATSCLVPRVEGRLREWLDRLAAAPDPLDAGGRITAELTELLDGYASAGVRGVMTSVEAFGTLDGPTTAPPAPPDRTRAGQELFLLHALCHAAEERGLFLQLLTGIEGGWGGGRVPVNDPRRILRLYGLFERYRGPFELVLGTELNNLDAVQAAWIFPHVHVGGMWWYNFRASTYRDSLQYRVEALPPSKCPIVVSDARCIEWCYGKVLLIKHLVADHLADQVERGWLDADDAHRVAGEWLYGAAAGRYDRPGEAGRAG
jgi:hypothetical protein